MRKLVFISYAHEDRTKAEELAAEVEKAHIPCWIAPRDVPFGANYAEAILDAIDTADVVVILLSSHANSSIFVAKEIERAVTYRKHILPVRLENIEPARRLEFHLADVQWLDLWSGSSDQPENIRRLIETIRARLQERAVPGPAPGPLRSVDLPARKPIPEPKVIGMMQPPSTSSQRLSFDNRRIRRPKLRIFLAAAFLALLGIVASPQLRLWVRSASSSQQAAGTHDILSVTASQYLNQAQKQLAGQLAVTLASKTAQKATDPWTVAQMTVALEKLVEFDHAITVNYLKASRDGRCGCWKEYGLAQVLGPSCWVLLALAKIQPTPDRDELKFLLNTQRSDGSWSIGRTSGDPGNSATYPTSWALLVLNEYRRKHRIVAELQTTVDQAISRGLQRLLSTRLPGKARWRDYPQADDGIESISDSALALHVIHELGAADPAVDRLWLRDLPAESIGILDLENPGHRVQLEDLSFFADATRRYKLPWCLIATRDTDLNASSEDHRLAQRWVERMLGNSSEMGRAIAAAPPHVAAELLIALRYLNADNGVL